MHTATSNVARLSCVASIRRASAVCRSMSQTLAPAKAAQLSVINHLGCLLLRSLPQQFDHPSRLVVRPDTHSARRKSRSQTWLAQLLSPMSKSMSLLLEVCCLEKLCVGLRLTFAGGPTGLLSAMLMRQLGTSVSVIGQFGDICLCRLCPDT